jgi:hypothetical protein
MDGAFSYPDFFWSVVDLLRGEDGQEIIDRFNLYVIALSLVLSDLCLARCLVYGPLPRPPSSPLALPISKFWPLSARLSVRERLPMPLPLLLPLLHRALSLVLFPLPPPPLHNSCRHLFYRIGPPQYNLFFYRLFFL